MNKHQLVETLHDLRFLHDVSQEHLVELANVASLRDFNAREVVFREGEVAKHVYLVVFGNVSLEICAPGIGCKRILTVGPGELLGWSALLDQSRWTATARTMTPTQLVALDAAPLLAICENNPQFGYEFMRRAMFALTTRLNSTRMQLLDVYGSQFPAIAQAGEEPDGR
jgi:CRP-like cAMP-binding protein